MNGWGPKSSIRPSKPGKSNFLGGISRDFAGISRGRPKSLRKKSLGSILVPYETLIFVTGTSGKLPEFFGLPTEKPKSAVDTQKTKKKRRLGIRR